MNFKQISLDQKPQLIDQLIKKIEHEFDYPEGEQFKIDFAPLLAPNNFNHLHLLIDDQENIIAHVGALPKLLGNERINFPVLFLGGIFVDYKYRGEGHLSNLLNHVINKYEGKVTLFLLWSDQSELYRKFNFYEFGGQIQTGFDPQIDSSIFTRSSFTDLSNEEKGELEALYNEHYKHFTTVLRDNASWHDIFSISSTNLYLWKKENRIIAYLCQNKGADLKNVIVEFAVKENYRQEFLDLIWDNTLWTSDYKPSNPMFNKLLYLSFLRVGHLPSFADFVLRYTNKEIILQEIHKDEVTFEFRGNIYHLAMQDFITGVWGPNRLEEFEHYPYPFYISGLDSI